MSRPRTKPDTSDAEFGEIADGKKWCDQCQSRVRSGCGKPLCKVPVVLAAVPKQSGMAKLLGYRLCACGSQLDRNTAGSVCLRCIRASGRMPDLSLRRDEWRTGEGPALRTALDEVERVFGVSGDTIMSRTRLRPFSLARHTVAFVLTFTSRWGVAEIGRRMGRTHKTTINSLNRARALMAGNPLYAELVAQVIESILAKKALP